MLNTIIRNCKILNNLRSAVTCSWNLGGKSFCNEISVFIKGFKLSSGMWFCCDHWYSRKLQRKITCDHNCGCDAVSLRSLKPRLSMNFRTLLHTINRSHSVLSLSLCEIRVIPAKKSLRLSCKCWKFRHWKLWKHHYFRPSAYTSK